MPYEIEPHGSKWWVVGPMRGERRHVYGKHDSRAKAVAQVQALHANEGK